VAFVLSALGARVAVYNRSRERSVALAEALPGVGLPEGQEVASRRWDVVVNCTPGDPFGLLGLPTSILAPQATAIDLVYNPPSTPFLQAAGREGARAIGGLEMLVHQGAKALELWLGRPAPVDVMRAAAREALG
jgi:shikimate dehydrogenase